MSNKKQVITPKRKIIHKAERIRRVNVIISLIVKGMRREQIWRYLTDVTINGETRKPNGLGWDIGERTFERYLSFATAEFKSKANVDTIEMIGKQINRLEEAYLGAMSDRDWRGVAALVKELNELTGLKKTFIELSGKVDTGQKDVVKGLIDEYKRVFADTGKPVEPERQPDQGL